MLTAADALIEGLTSAERAPGIAPLLTGADWSGRDSSQGGRNGEVKGGSASSVDLKKEKEKILLPGGVVISVPYYPTNCPDPQLHFLRILTRTFGPHSPRHSIALLFYTNSLVALLALAV